MAESPAPRRRPTISRVLSLARPEWAALAAGTLFLAIGSLAGLVYPQAMRLVLDGATGQGGPTPLGPPGPALVRRAAVAMAIIAVAQGVAIALRYLLFTLVGERTVARLRRDLFRRILEQEIAFFDERRTGELVSRLAADTEAVQGAVSTSVSMALRNLASAVGGVGFLFFTSARLTLVMLAVVPPVAIGAVVYGWRIRRLSRAAQDALAQAGEIAEEGIAGIRTVRSFAAEEREAGRYAIAIQRVYELARRRARAGGAFMAGAATAAYLAVAVVLWYGGRLVMAGSLTVGALTSFLVYTLIVAFSLGALADLWATFMKAAGAAERIFELSDRVPAMAPAGGAVLPMVEGKVALEGVHFAYPSRPHAPVLRGIDLAIAPGEVVALVGPSGAGKSTVAALVGRLYDPTGGAVTVDGRDLRGLDPAWWRGQVGVVAQEPILFSASIAENIRYGRRDAGDAEVEAAARAANAHDFASRFPDGYATAVGERGVQLSGGQKQRIAIARAVLKDPRVLVLDEATSALDAESESLVQEALERLMRGRTVLVIAHRLSTVRRADRVVVLEDGRVVQKGSHAQLVSEDGPYRRLVERQFLAA
ncbi:MAG TPA: ABC transporter transmembrane domain-containing protein [Anaeromyxobacteraceae bacterium]|nr:ABC transporter transmembrane domain-containing protein [Anaeromyxobacteraceae bacterium]